MGFKKSWQNILTKIDDRIPIKKITGPMDRKNPLISFFLFILIILIVLFLIFGSSFTSTKGNYTDVTFRFADNEDNILSNFSFKLNNLSDNILNTYITNESGSFTISLDKDKIYFLIVENSDFEFFEQEIIFDRNTFNFILTLIDVPTFFSKQLYFQDAYSNQRITEELKVTINCDNGEVITPSFQDVSNGVISFQVPLSCKALVADIVGDKYNEVSRNIALTESVISLNPKPPQLDFGNVFITLMSGDEFIEESISLSIFSIDDSVTSLRTIQSNFSQGNFTNMPIGQYVVKASDNNNRYLPSQKEVNIIKNNVSEIIINMQDSESTIIDPETNEPIELREITVFVKDLETNEIIDDEFYPVVTLLLDGYDNILEKSKQDGFVFKINKNKEYSIKAIAEGYLPKIVTVTESLDVYNINLEKITLSNVSNIYVSIFDEDNKPIIGITSWIYDDKGEFINPLYSYSITDENGLAVFKNIPEIDFTIKTKNLYIEETSNVYTNTPPEDTNISLPVVIGNGTINLSVKNRHGDNVANSFVNFYSESGEFLGTDITSNLGSLSKSIKADKRVYLKIKSEGYLTYYTDLFRIYKNKIINKEVILERPSDISQIEIDYLGLFNTLEQEVDSLKNNDVFYLKFKVSMPANTNNFNFAFIAGSESDVKDDIVYILPENTSLAVSSYFNKEPFNVSGNYLESKLINLSFHNYPQSSHEITIPIRLKNAKINDSVSFFYKASLDPIIFMSDNYRRLNYFADATSLCDGAFCFSGQYIDVLEGLRYDIKSNMLVAMKINSEYILEYVISNASQKTYPSARLSVRNVNNQLNPTAMVSIFNYDISGEFSSIGSTAFGDYKYNIPFQGEEILTNNIAPFSHIDFNLKVMPLIIGQSKYMHRFVSDNQIIQELPLNFITSKLENMYVDYEPKNIVPGIPFTLKVNVKDSSQNNLSGVNVNILQKVNNNYVTVSTGKKTNVDGEVLIPLPSLRSGEVFIIEAIKSKYYADPIEFTISKDILDVLHENKVLSSQLPLNVFIHKMDIDGETYNLTLENKTEYPLTLKPFEDNYFSFNKAYLLNISQTKNFLNNQIHNGIEIPANESIDLLIKFAPSQSAQVHPVSEDILGAITGVVSLNNYDHEFNVPVSVKLSVGSGVLYDDCLVVTTGLSEWNTVVSTTSQTTSLSIRNTCLSKEGQRPITIKNVQAKIKSNKDRFGIYFLRVIGPGSASQIQLSENYYRIVINEMLPEEEYIFEITYNTNGVKFANVETDIFFNAQVETEEGLAFVNSGSGELLLKTNIKVLDLIDCFSYFDDDGRQISSGGLFVIEGKDEKYLTIKNNCQGDAVFEMNLCDGHDYGCRDLKISGTEENNILRFGFNDSQKIVGINRKDSTKAPGAYLLNNLISVKNNHDRTLASSYFLLKINIKEPNGLWMHDPFIEISEIEDKIESQVVRLYNSDIETTLWHYLTNTHTDFTVPAGEDGFNKNLEFYRNIKFTDFESLQASRDPNYLLPIAGTYLGGGLLTIAITQGWNPVGWVAGGIILYSALSNSFRNTYDIDNQFYIFELDSKYFEEDKLKNINLQNQSSDISYLSVVDMTALENFNFYRTDLIVKGKLIKKETFTNLVNSCPYNQKFVGIYENFYEYNGCSLDSVLNAEDNSFKYDIECSGSWPRNKIRLKHSAYLVCKNNEDAWPEQAGIKPLKFTLKEDLYDYIYKDSRKYHFKEIKFYPTLDDLSTQNNLKDPFINASSIGEFRFGYFLTRPEETPNYDLNVIDCMTDTGKIGKTGEGAVPNISFDWSWNLEDINKCSETYCDATQLTQVILNRINKAKDLISLNEVSCPISPSEILDGLNDGSYMVSADPKDLSNDVPVDRVGISKITMDTIDDELKVKVTLENRTVIDQNVSLSLSLGNNTPLKIETINNNTGALESLSISDNINVTIKDNDLLPLIYTFGSSNSPILGDNIPLNVNITSPVVYSDHSSFNSILNLSVYEAHTTSDCQVPATTIRSGGISYIDMWFNENIYPDNVTFSWNQEDIKKLKEILEFDVYLITDNYNKNFINDFDVAYGGLASKEDGSGAGIYSLMESPADFEDGYLSDLFKNNLVFLKEFSDQENNVNINVPGKYKVRIDFLFDNSSWRFSTGSKSNLEAFVTFRFLQSPEFDSIFYRLPFNGFVGHTISGYNRQGYGLSYTGDVISIDGKNVITDYDVGSNPLRTLNITKSDNIYRINSGIDTRGSVLNLSYNNNIVDMVLSPSSAVPLLLKIEKNNTTPLNVFYRLKDQSDNALVDSTSLLRWTGVGSGCDFSGMSIYNQVYYDRYAGVNGPQFTYMIDWPQVIRIGTIYLRSIFYVPENQRYVLENRSDQGVGIGFSKTGDEFNPSISLSYNSNDIDVSSLNTIFDLVKDKKICVVNSSDGQSSDFFYNPAEIYSTNQKFIENPSDSLECS